MSKVPIHTYSPELGEKLLRMAQEGHSIAAFRATYLIPERQFKEWLNNHEEFKEAVELAKCIEYTFWETEILKALTEGSSMYSFDKEGKISLSPKDRLSMAFNMLKHQSSSFHKVYGRSISESGIEDDISDPTEFGANKGYGRDIREADTN